jgi:hypothetical protein
LLGISEFEPPLPTKPTERDMIVNSNTCKSLKQYAQENYEWVVWNLSNVLYDHPKISLRAPLAAQRTPSFDAMTPGTRMRSVPTTYKEPWNMENCMTSLTTSGLYEGSLTIWQFEPVTEVWEVNADEKVNLGVDAVAWPAVVACQGFWSRAALKSSASDASDGRYVFPTFLLTAVKTIDAIRDLIEHNNFFSNLPCLASHAVMWSIIDALHEVLAALKNDPTNMELLDRLVKLYEASVTVTGRMRLNPSSAQLTLDQLSYVDQLRMLNVGSGATSCFEWFLSVLRLPGVDATLTGPQFQGKLNAYGVTFKGKGVDRNLAYAILSIVGIADRGEGMAAVRFLERINPVIVSDVTKLMRICQTIKKICAPEELHDACRMVMECMAVSILSGDEEADNFTVEYVVPKEKMQKGFVHTCGRKLAFNRWLLDFASNQAASGATNGAVTCDGVSAIRRTCFFPSDFWNNFSEDVAQDRTK